MADTLSIPSQAPVAVPVVKKAKTTPVKLFNDVWIADENDEPVRLRTNIKKLNDDGSPVFDAKKGIYVTEQIIHELPIDVAKIVLAEKKGERADPLPE